MAAKDLNEARWRVGEREVNSNIRVSFLEVEQRMKLQQQLDAGFKS